MRFKNSKPEKQRSSGFEGMYDGFPKMKSVQKEKQKSVKKKWKSFENEDYDFS